MRRRMRLFLPLALLAGAARGEAGGASEAEFLADFPLVLTASRIAQSPLDAPAPVTVIDWETIQASGFTEIHDLFRLVPGFQVADWGKGSPVVINHGLGDGFPRRMEVLLNGRSILSPFRGGVDWQDLPIRVTDIERIEVVRGPNQAVYGANAFQGVINIVTREPSVDHGGEVLLRAGQTGIGETYARLGGGGAQTGWRLNASSRRATNFRDLATTGQVWGEQIERQTLNALWSYRPDVDSEWRVHLGLAQGDDWLSATTDSTPGHQRAIDSRYLQVGWRQAYGTGSERSLQYYHFAREEEQGYTLLVGALTVPFNLGSTLQRDALEFQDNHVWSDALRGVWGLGVRHDQASSPNSLYGLGTVRGNEWHAFANLDWLLAPRWRLNAGAMLEKHYYTDALFSPRLAVNFAMAPSHTLRFSAGKGYRAPTIFEASSHEVVVYDDGTGTKIGNVERWSDQAPDAEQVRFAELGWVGRYARIGLQVDTRLFIEKYRGYIDQETCIARDDTVGQDFWTNLPHCVPALPNYVPVYTNPTKPYDKAFRYVNSGDLEVRGGDVTFDWRHRDYGRFLLSQAATVIHAGPNTDRDAEVSAPLHSTSLLWSKGWAWGIQSSIGWYRVGEFKWLNDGDIQSAYRRWDARIAKRLGKRGSGDELALTLQNFNDEHAEFDDRKYLVERRVFLTLRLSW